MKNPIKEAFREYFEIWTLDAWLWDFCETHALNFERRVTRAQVPLVSRAWLNWLLWKHRDYNVIIAIYDARGVEVGRLDGPHTPCDH